MKRYILAVSIFLALATVTQAATLRGRIFRRQLFRPVVTVTVTESLELIEPEPVVTSSKRMMRLRRMPLRGSGLTPPGRFLYRPSWLTARTERSA